MNLCKEILLGLFLLFTAFFIGRRLLALAAVVCDTHASFRIQQRELLNAKRQGRRYMPLSVLVEAGKDPKALLATLDSLQHQTYTLFEIVILEDSMAPAAVEALTKQLELLPLPQPVRRQLKCTPETAIYENCTGTVSLRLVRKSRTSLGDTWNLGVNIARYPYFTCIRAGTVLCQDSLDKLMDPFFQYRDIQAAGGSLQCAGITLACPLSILETLEFDRSIPALQTLLQSRTLMLCGGPAAYRKDAAIEAGARRVFLIEEPLAAGLGAGLNLKDPNGHMVVDIGGGTSDIAVISLSGVVESASIKVAGDQFNESIVKYMRRKHNVLVGERTAELMKMEIGCVFPKEQETSIEIKGRCLMTGLPKVITVTSTEMLEAFEEPVERILEAVHGVLERTPPELVADISNNGIVMTGGGSLVDGFDRLIEARTGIHTMVAEDAISCVAEGTGKSLDSLNAMTDGTVNLSRRRQMN